jgi:predicted ABC-type ATPase
LSLPYAFLDKRPIVIALAGSNGAGKSTFYESYLVDGGLRFINAGELSVSLGVPACEAAELAASIRRELVSQRESFIFETVLSDPVGEKADQFHSYAALGYTVVLISIRIESADESVMRVSMRACQGGHDVPDEKIRARFDRTQANLQRAIQRLPYVIIFSNQDLSNPFQFVAHYENGQKMERRDDL